MQQRKIQSFKNIKYVKSIVKNKSEFNNLCNWFFYSFIFVGFIFTSWLINICSSFECFGKSIVLLSFEGFSLGFLWFENSIFFSLRTTWKKYEKHHVHQDSWNVNWIINFSQKATQQNVLKYSWSFFQRNFIFHFENHCGFYWLFVRKALSESYSKKVWVFSLSLINRRLVGSFFMTILFLWGLRGFGWVRWIWRD